MIHVQIKYLVDIAIKILIKRQTLNQTIFFSNILQYLLIF